mgnify:FL=1
MWQMIIDMDATRVTTAFYGCLLVIGAHGLMCYRSMICSLYGLFARHLSPWFDV